MQLKSLDLRHATLPMICSKTALDCRMNRRGTFILAAITAAAAPSLGSANSGSGGSAMAARHQGTKSGGDAGKGLPLSSITDEEAREHAPQPPLLERRKTVHFVRHGEGYHNVGLDELEDSPLTSRGWADALGLRAHVDALAALGRPLRLEAVFVSPLTRALETACCAFGGEMLEPEEEEGGDGGSTCNSTNNGSSGTMRRSKSSGSAASFFSAASSNDGNTGINGDDGNGGGSPRVLLMQAQAHAPGKHAAHPAVAAVAGRPFIAVEEFRERMSNHKCDKRRPLSALRGAFPGVDFSLIRHEGDVLWEERHVQAVNEGARGSRYLVAERSAAVVARGTRFIEWLLQRPEREVAVVAHREVLLRTLGALACDAAPDLRKALSAGFGHCEMRSVVFDELGTPVEVLASTHYPGGAARLWLFPWNWALQHGRRAIDGVRGYVGAVGGGGSRSGRGRGASGDD